MLTLRHLFIFSLSATSASLAGCNLDQSLGLNHCYLDGIPQKPGTYAMSIDSPGIMQCRLVRGMQYTYRWYKYIENTSGYGAAPACTQMTARNTDGVVFGSESRCSERVQPGLQSDPVYRNLKIGKLTDKK